MKRCIRCNGKSDLFVVDVQAIRHDGMPLHDTICYVQCLVCKSRTKIFEIDHDAIEAWQTNYVGFYDRVMSMGGVCRVAW